MEDLGQGEQNAQHDAQDRLLFCANREFDYDEQGQRIWASCNGRETEYAYDGLGNLMDVYLPDGDQLSYLYDGAGRRSAKLRNGTLERGWLYEDSLRIAAELDGNQAVRSEFYYGLSPNVPDGMEQGGRNYRLLTDHLGSVNYVVDAQTGEVVQALEYDEWGKVLKDTNPGLQPFAYAGGLYDAATGLVRFGRRDYDAREGRWTTKDPIGLAGGWNVYTYVGGNPISFVDPDGLAVTDPNGGWGGPQNQIIVGDP